MFNKFLLLACVLLPIGIVSHAVNLKMGADSRLIQQKVSTTSVTTSPIKTWNRFTGTGTITPSTPDGNPDDTGIGTDPVSRSPHLTAPTEDVTPIGGGDLNSVLTPVGGSGPVNITGPGSAVRVATAAGTVTIRPYLWTTGGARMTVKVRDSTGTVKMVFDWNRPDGNTKALAKLNGVAQNDSMFLDNPPNDWTAKTGLSYTFTVAAGDRIKARTSSGADSVNTFLKLNGPF